MGGMIEPGQISGRLGVLIALLLLGLSLADGVCADDPPPVRPSAAPT